MKKKKKRAFVSVQKMKEKFHFQEELKDF